MYRKGKASSINKSSAITLHAPNMGCPDSETAFGGPANCHPNNKFSGSILIHALNWGGSLGFAFPKLSSICDNKENGETIAGLTATVASYKTVGQYVEHDNMYWCEYSGIYSYKIDQPTCQNGSPHVVLRDIILTGYSVLSSISIRLSGPVQTEQLKISTDRWYPEECVARAQRG